MSAYPQWQFVGNVPENYERYVVPSIFAPWAHDLIAAAALRPGERVLDIACGTGIVARTAARTLGSGASVVGLDLSAPMLAAARSAAKAEGVSVEWREGSAVKLPLADATFDVAFCQQGLQFFPDRPAALSEMYRVLAPTRRPGAESLVRNRAKPGFCRAGGRVDTSYKSRGWHANDLRAVRSEQSGGATHSPCWSELRRHHNSTNAEESPLSVTQRVRAPLRRWIRIGRKLGRRFGR